MRRPLKIPLSHRGMEVIQDPLFNKGTAFEPSERDRLGLRGLLPPKVNTMNEQCMRVMTTLRGLPADLDKHVYLSELHDRNETLFHRVPPSARRPRHFSTAYRSRRRRECHADIPWRRVAAPPRPRRGYSAETRIRLVKFR